ncbi:MAG: elongation factor [Candidatus Sumerlaeota bacterium]|nr:elongation factor [Candidatus Sumerlaeota bacterium]
MKLYNTDQIRNVALVGHSASGKTSLAEALLHINGVIPKPGRVEEGNTASDYDPEEVKRQISISTTLLPIESGDLKINVLDCPGFRDFVGEIKNAIRVAELAMVVVDATTGVEVGTEFAHDFAQEYQVPTAFFINKMDKERANFAEAMSSIDSSFEDVHTIPVTLPIGSEADFKGVIDLMSMKAVYDEGGKRVEKDIPEEMLEEAQLARRALVEAAAEGNDELTEKFLLEESLSDDEVIFGLRQDLEAGRFCPVLCGSASREIGLSVLMNFFRHECPPPTERKGFLGWANKEKTETELKKLDPNTDFSAYVFKTVNDEFVGRLSFFKVITGQVHGDGMIKIVRTGLVTRVGHVFSFRGKQQLSTEGLATGDIGAFTKLEGARTGDTIQDPKGHDVEYEPTHLPKATVHVAIEAKARGDEDKLGTSIHRMIDIDPTLRVERDSLLHQTVLSGMGDTHLEVVHSRIESTYKVDFAMKPARVQYRETISKAGEGQGKFKKQTGGRGQYGDCWIRLRPTDNGEHFEFEWKIVGGVIPTNFTSSVEKGIVKAMERGIVAGYPVINVHAECYDGSYHAVDSSDTAFQVAASLGFKNVAAKCDPVLLEPINRVVIEVPDQYMGDVMGYVSGKRGRISGNDQLGHRVRITADVPAAEMATFSRDLRSMTQGRSIFESDFHHYEPVPPGIAEKVIAEVRIDHQETE